MGVQGLLIYLFNQYILLHCNIKMTVGLNLVNYTDWYVYILVNTVYPYSTFSTPLSRIIIGKYGKNIYTTLSCILASCISDV